MKPFSDLYFTYRYTFRFMLNQKVGGCVGTYAVPDVSKLALRFSLRKLEDKDSVEVYNYVYLLKFFFGWKASLTKLNSKYSLGKWYHSFSVVIALRKPKLIYPLLFNFFSNVLVNVDNSFIQGKFLSKNLNIFSYVVRDLNVFSELKTNLGLFYLRKPLNFEIFFIGADYKHSSAFLRNIKCQ